MLVAAVRVDAWVVDSDPPSLVVEIVVVAVAPTKRCRRSVARASRRSNKRELNDDVVEQASSSAPLGIGCR